MVAIQEVRAEIANLKRFGQGLVGVFVGGTSGIGETTAREFVRYAVKPRIYLIGRNQEQATRITAECRELNPDSQIDFIQSDVSLLKNVDKVCEELKTKEKQINLLCLTPGVMTMKGRDETPEGLDKKFALHYYSRLRFTQNLLPLLNNAAASATETVPPNGVGTTEQAQSSSKAPISRVISVLAGGLEVANLDTSDLSLKNNFSLRACAGNTTTMTTLAFQQLSESNQAISFIHSSPGGVATNLLRDFNKVAQIAATAVTLLLKPLMTSVKESGERHLWAGMSDRFSNGATYTIGMSGEKANNEKVLSQLQQSGMKEIIWAHTSDVFQKICDEGGKYE